MSLSHAKPLVTGIVAAYNYERYLAEALESALAQEYPQERLELIVVDDGSTDATPEIAQRYVDRSNGRIRYIRQENAGLAAATTRGLQEARGELITLLDADDIWPADRTGALVAALEQNPRAGLAYGDMEVIDANGLTLAPSWAQAEGAKTPRGRVLSHLLLGNFISAPALMVRADLLAQFCPIPTFAPYQDWYIAACVATTAEIEFVPARVSRYRLHGDNMNHGKRQPSEVADVLRAELRLRRWMLATLRSDELTIEDCIAAHMHFMSLYQLVAHTDGVAIERVIEVSADDRVAAEHAFACARGALAEGRFVQAAGHFLAVLAADPFDERARTGLDHARRGLAVPLPRAIETPASPSPARDLCIKPGYTHRAAPEYFVDLIQERDHVVWQPDVYPRAAAVGTQLGARRIIDLGPGSGDKLAALYPRFEIVGVDFGPNLEMCRHKFPMGSWREHDFDSAADLPLTAAELEHSVVVCADVIEHLVHPELLLDNLRAILPAVEAIVLSTPERDLTRGADDMGPPEHLCHVREWSIQEFAALLESWDFQHGTVELTRSNDLHHLRHTTMAVLFPDAERAERIASTVALAA